MFVFRALPLLAGVLAAAACHGGDPSRLVRDGDSLGRAQGLTQGVSGKVSSATYGPIVGAGVVPKSLDDPPAAVPELWVSTDQDGGYEWSLPPGRYALTVRVDGYKPDTQETKVGNGEVVTLDFFLEAE